VSIVVPTVFSAVPLDLLTGGVSVLAVCSRCGGSGEKPRGTVSGPLILSMSITPSLAHGIIYTITHPVYNILFVDKLFK
jgi:hypothetical protein